jgi:hypothetical protein
LVSEIIVGKTKMPAFIDAICRFPTCACFPQPGLQAVPKTPGYETIGKSAESRHKGNF